jgi:hypothetical protein
VGGLCVVWSARIDPALIPRDVGNCRPDTANTMSVRTGSPLRVWTDVAQMTSAITTKSGASRVAASALR